MANAGWPEAFGFSISGNAPVVICEVEEGGSAQQAGLQPGDIIAELDGEDARDWSREEVLEAARSAEKVPPSMVVVSRKRTFSIPRARDGGFGLTLRGDSPVFIRSVDFDSPAREAGLRSGDLLLEVNGEGVRYSSKSHVLELLKRAVHGVTLAVITGGLGAGGDLSSSLLTDPTDSRNAKSQRYHKAKAFRAKLNYFLMEDEMKKSHVLSLLRLYAKDKDVGSLGRSLDLLLESSIERRLIMDIRSFVHLQHLARFDTLVSSMAAASCDLLGSHGYHSSFRRASHDMRRGSISSAVAPTAFSSLGRNSPWRSSMPNLAIGKPRLVRIVRERGEFGFTLSGNAPVFVRSVDPHGPAERSGLSPGDFLFKLNGLDIRKATHSQVVRLLKGSGTHPSLLVSANLSSEGPAGPRGRTHGPSPSSSSSSSPSSYWGGAAPGGMSRSQSRMEDLSTATMKKNSAAFKTKMEQVLCPEERDEVVKQLTAFSQKRKGDGGGRNMEELVNGLIGVLGDSNKNVLFHYVCNLLPEEAQREFDRIAASSLSQKEGGGVVKAAQTSEEADDVLYRVQSQRLPEEDTLSSSRVESHHFGSKAPHPQAHLPHHYSPHQPGRDSSPLVRERLNSDEKQSLRTKRESLEKSDVGQNLSAPPSLPPTTPGSQQAHLKRVNWEKIHGIEGTIWRELSGLEETLEYIELEKQFANQQAKKLAEDSKKKKEQKHILEARKAHNISILLAHLRLSFDEIKGAVLSCDHSVLSEQHLRQMEHFAPDSKESLALSRYRDNPSLLSSADLFSFKMNSISLYRERLRAMVYRIQFKEKLGEIKPDLEAISKASIQLQKSRHFKRILEIVLAVGNYMNAGHQRTGSAQGFRISFLTQLKSLRTSDKKSTLLHYLANLVERKYPQVLEFPSDLTSVAMAARVSGQTLEAEISELTEGLTDIRRCIREVISAEIISGDRFEEVMKSFVAEAEQDTSELVKLHRYMKQDYDKAVRFFGEEPRKMRIDDFFGTFVTFTKDFENAVKDNQKARELEAMKEKRTREREEIAKKKTSEKVSSRQMKKQLSKELKAQQQPKHTAHSSNRQQQPGLTHRDNEADYHPEYQAIEYDSETKF